MKKRILFVDSNPAELQQIQAFLGTQAQEWDLVVQDSGAGALRELAATACDLIVTDYQLSDLSGLELLNQATGLCPKIGTIVLAKLEDKDSTLKCVGIAHQLLGKPFDEVRLKAAIHRAFDANAWLPDQAVRELTKKMTRLPSPPGLYFRILKEAQVSDHALENIGWLIARDPAMTSRLLQLVNSASLGLAIKVTNPIEAVMHLGLKMTQSLVLFSHGCAFLEQAEDCRFAIEKMWRHSTRTSFYSRMIAKVEKAGIAVMEEAFTAGLLHDIGKLVLAANHTDAFSEALKLAKAEKLSDLESERSVFGTTHAEVGAYLLATWGLPWSIVEAVALHHRPAQVEGKRFCSLTAVHVADALEYVISGGENSPPMDLAYLGRIGLADRLALWHGSCRDSEN